MKMDVFIRKLLYIILFEKITYATNIDCFIEVKQEKSEIPPEPPFLKMRSLCKDGSPKGPTFKCGNSGVFVKPECFCSFHQIWNGRFNNFTPCPNNMQTGKSEALNCSMCRTYSKNYTGPCINGGTLRCPSYPLLAKHIKCLCPVGYHGQLCQLKTVNITRPCIRLHNKNERWPDCKNTSKRCTTWNRNRTLQFLCDETEEKFPGRDIPVCSEYSVGTASEGYQTQGEISGGTYCKTSFIVFFIVCNFHSCFRW